MWTLRRTKHGPWPKRLARGACVGLIAVILSAIVVGTDGNLFAGGGFVGLLAVIAVTVYRLDWGINLFVLAVMLFDQFEVPGFPSFTFRVGYFLNLSTIEYLPSLPQGIVTPMELHLLFVSFIWAVLLASRRMEWVKGIPLKASGALFMLAVVSGLVHGFVKGGDLVVSLWETRALIYFGIMLVLVPQIVRTEEQVRMVIWFAIIGIAVKALQGAIRFASLRFSFGWWPNIYETLTNHEDPLFFSALFILLTSFVIFGWRGKQRRVLKWLSIPLGLGFIASNRRAAYASLIMMAFGYFALMPSKMQARMYKGLGVFLILFSLYLGAFWNNPYGRFGAVALQVKSTVTGEGGVRGEYKDRTSTLYRLQENYNLAQTIQASPILGLGFGIPFQMPIKLVNININKLGKFIPHNQILWVFMRMGIVGAFCFWFFMNTYIAWASIVFLRLNDVYFKSVCAVAVTCILGQLVVSYVDMQLTWYRNMVFLGLLMGLVPVLARLDATTKPSSQDRPVFAA